MWSKCFTEKILEKQKVRFEEKIGDSKLSSKIININWREQNYGNTTNK